MVIQCITCGQAYPAEGVPYCCAACGGLFDYSTWEAAAAECDPAQPGIWRYRSRFGLPPSAPALSLGEGNTPLLWTEAGGQEVALKCEYLNPSGSYKDRGAATLLSFLLSRGVDAAIEDSSGNAGAAFAAYAARAGVQARVFVPASASGAKRQQIEAYGAEVVRVPGTRQDVAQATLRAAQAGAAYASHLWMPQVLPGYATMAYEIVEQMRRAPATLIAPVGAGGMLLGIARGFAALQRAGKIERSPRLVGVQAAACAPFLSASGEVPSAKETLAEGVRITKPLRLQALRQSVQASGGFFVSVEEAAILPGRHELARRGFYVEPTSAIVWDAVRQVVERVPQPVLLILTGRGLKWLAP